MTVSRPPDTAVGLVTDPARREAIAAEYVLGTLDAQSAARVATALVSEPAWREAVTQWEARLAPLALLVRPETPPNNLWDRIGERIAPAEPPKQRQRRRAGWLWTGWAIVASLLAAALAGYILYPRGEQPRVLAVLSNDRNLPGVLVEVDRAGRLRMTTLAATTGRLLQAPSGRAFHLWSIVPGATAPTSLGVLPSEPGRQLVLAVPRGALMPDAIVQISLEADGGSTTGAPAGPVIYIGRLGLGSPEIEPAP